MKKALALLLCLICAFLLLACTPGGSDETTEGAKTNTLLVGFGREDITPTFSVPMRGYGNPSQRYSTNVLDKLYSTCIAFTDEDGNTVLLFHNDLCSTPGSVYTPLRKQISELTGIPFGNIMFSATHTHSGPEQTLDGDSAVELYNEFAAEKMIKAAQAALADRKPAQMYTASTNLKNLNFVRHYVMSDGSIVGSNFGSATGKTYVEHVQPVDDQMQLIRFKREGGKDVVLVNWQVHPLRTGGSSLTNISADVVGAMRMYLEPQMNCHMAYFTGGSGDVEPVSRIQSENITESYLEQGEAMARGAILACDNMTRQETGKVQILQRELKTLVHKNEVTLGQSYAFSIGDVAFTTHQYEMFDSNGKYVKENSPFAMTFVVTCANSSGGYIAAEWAYAYGGYEVEYTGYVKGTGEQLAKDYVQMLEELYPTRKYDVDPAPEAPLSDAPLVYNLDQGAQLKADANGAYSVRFLQDGKIVTYQVTDKALLDEILQLDLLGIQLEGNTVNGIVYMQNMPYQRLAWDYVAQSVATTAAKLNSSTALLGNEVMIKLQADSVIYDIAPLSANFGSTTQLQSGDKVTVVADTEGKVKYVYVTDRAATLGSEKKYCQHCKEEVLWYDWLSATDLPTSDGHYTLTNDVNMVANAKVGAGQLCLDLNGKTVTQTSFGTRIYVVSKGGTLSIMDSVGGGTFIPASTENSGSYAKWGMIINTEDESCTVNLYSGTLDASKCTAQYGCAINQTQGTFNMYGGTILGGTAYGTGSSAIRAGGNFNMYGGKIVGGKLIDIGYVSQNPVGGAVIRVGGTVTIYDGIIEGGESFTYGGILYISDGGKLIMKGGTITGGKASAGGGVYVNSLSYVYLSGNAKITGNENGNLYINKDAKVFLGSDGLGADANIGITMKEAGTFITDVPAGVNLSKYFTSDEAGKKIVNNGDGSWSVK